MKVNLTADQSKLLKRAAGAGVGKQNEEYPNLTEDELAQWAVDAFVRKWETTFERIDRDKLTYPEVKEKLAARGL